MLLHYSGIYALNLIWLLAVYAQLMVTRSLRYLNLIIHRYHNQDNETISITSIITPNIFLIVFFVSASPWVYYWV